MSLSSKWHFHVLAQFLVAKKGGGDIGQKRERVVSMESFHKFSSHEISRACWYYLSKDKLQITAPNSTNYQRYGPYKTPKWLKFRVSLGCKDSSPHLPIRVVTLLFFHSGAIYHVHRKHGALTRKLSTNTATADNLKHTSDPKTLSFTRNDPLRTSVPSRGWGARTRALTCLAIAHQGGDIALFSLRSHLPRPQRTWWFDKKSVD